MRVWRVGGLVQGRTFGLLAALLTVALLVFLDARTKSWAATELRERGPRAVAGGQIALRYQENPGLAFGLLREGGEARRLGLVAYSAAASLVIAALLIRRLVRDKPPGVLIPAGLAALLGGTLGNLRDRAVHGFVVDFIDYSAGGRVRWPTFNVADVAIAIGIALCLGGLAAQARMARQPQP